MLLSPVLFDALCHALRHSIFCVHIDPKDQIKVSIQRPFGIDLEEAEEGKASGVFIKEIFSDGNAAKSKDLCNGLFMMSVGGVDVKNMDFDSIIDTISSMPQDEPVDCVFIDPAKVMKGPAIIDVKLPTVPICLISLNISWYLSYSFVHQLLIVTGIALYLQTFDASTGEPIEKTIQIQAMKGQTMRRVLLDSGVDLYDMKGKATNCGGAGQCGTCVVKMTIPDGEITKFNAYFLIIFFIMPFLYI